jgi:hypothetical protein
MTDRPIIFSGPMVAALLDDRKSQTRRLATSPLRKCEPGDRLWVRETCCAAENVTGDDGVIYRATIETREPDDWEDIEPTAKASELWGMLANYGKGPRRNRADEYVGLSFAGPWVPSIHMPRWASRLTLIVEEVRFQPLQAITEADCLAEGPRVRGYVDFGERCSLNGVMVHTDQEHVFATPRCWYRELWSSLHTKEGERWDDNPEIVAITFRVERGNIDRIAA